MNKDLKNILFTQEEIQKKVKEIAAQLNEDYKGEEVIFVCVLKGSLPFYTDLVREVNFPVTFDMVCVSSYGSSAESSGTLKIKLDSGVPFEGKNVLIVEDILDTGNTLSNLLAHFAGRKPKSIKLCCLLDKPSRRLRDIEADYKGFEIPDEFVVGYGLDYAEKYRELPYIGILKPEVYQNN
jgi:hypoxanthine phosphoribosyltransferase